MLCIRDGTMTCGVHAKIDTIGRIRHESAASRRVVNFVIAIGLSILIDDETRHFCVPVIVVKRS